MNKKGFTLIELLAVIVIIGVIALIIVPIVTDVIDNSKKALQASAYGLIESGKTYYSNSLLKPNLYQVPKTFEGPSYENLEFDGKKYVGRLIVKDDKNIAVAIHDEGLCAYKLVKDSKVAIEKIDSVDTCLNKAIIPICEKKNDSEILYKCEVGNNLYEEFYLLNETTDEVSLLYNNVLPESSKWIGLKNKLNEFTKEWNNIEKITIPTFNEIVLFMNNGNNDLISNSVFWTRGFYDDEFELQNYENSSYSSKMELNEKINPTFMSPELSCESVFVYNKGNRVQVCLDSSQTYPIRPLIIISKKYIDTSKINET